MDTDIKTIDLQIFLGRAADSLPTGENEIPSLFLAGTSRQQGARIYREQSQDAEDGPDATEIGYIAIANSEVVEIVRFPFAATSIQPLVERLTRNELTLQQCINWGALLFDFVFHRAIRDTFRRLLVDRTQLRITVATSVPELIFVPWELLCDTFPGLLPRFLCYDRSIHLIRSLRLYNRSDVPPKILGDGQELRILLVTSNPATDGYIDVVKEERMLRFVIEETPALANVRFEVLHEANVDSLRDKLREFLPHVVHIACHGGYDPHQALGFVALDSSKEPGTIDRVNSYRFAAMIQEPGTVQLVFANTCYGAFQVSSSAFSGIAQCLHATGIPEVVTLQFQLQDKTAHAIVLNFYKYLLRDGSSVERSVSQVRRHLFINGYIFPETFGLTIYQGNATYAWPQNVSASRIAEDGGRGFNEIQEFFDAELKKQIIERLSVEFEKNRQALSDLDSLTAEDILLTHRVFDNLDLALKILRDVRTTGVPLDSFLHILSLAKILCLTVNEGHLVGSAIVLQKYDDFQAYLAKFALAKNAPVPWDVFDASIKEIVATAIKATGENQALFAVVDETKHVRIHVQDLQRPDEGMVKPVGIDPKWSRLCAAVRESGVALLLPGDARVKVIVEGEQRAEFSGGTWRRANFKEIYDGFVRLAQRESLMERLCVSIMNKCLVASERRRGLSIILQRNKLVRLHPGYFDVQAREDNMGLRDKPIFEIEDKNYLEKVAGDNAVVISSLGHTLAFNASLGYSADTAVDNVAGTGARHLSAQKVTKETDAIAFVVSEDGPLSVFQNGRRIEHYL